jgi:hypothetical protein
LKIGIKYFGGKIMGKKILGIFFTLLGIIAWGMNEGEKQANAQTAPEGKAEGKTEAKPITSLEDLKNLLGLNIYLQGGYTYNFVNPDSGTNEQRLFDKKANTFLLDLAQIQLAKEAAMGGLGYKLKVNFGETAKYIHSAGMGNPGDAYDLTEAYIDYVAAMGNGLKFRFGKFATYLGAEVVEARDNFNYSRSFLYNYATPFTHTGLMAGYKFSDAFTANVYLVNGWDVSDDNNKGKSVGASFAITPIETVQLTFNFIYGPEQTNNSSNNRFLFDWIGAFKATKRLTFMANIDYGSEKDDPKNGGNNSEWYGVAGYAKYEFTEVFSAIIRGEYFDDKNGVRTGIAQKLKEITLTAEFKIAKDLLLRPEYRHDWSNQNGFDSQNAKFNKKNQDTIAVGVMYTW